MKTLRADGRPRADMQMGPAPESSEAPSDGSAATALPELACSLASPLWARGWTGSRVHGLRLLEETGAQTSPTRQAWADGRPEAGPLVGTGQGGAGRPGGGSDTGGRVRGWLRRWCWLGDCRQG